MKLLFNKEVEYTSPVCKVYSVRFESLMLTMSGGNGEPGEEDEWGELN